MHFQTIWWIYEMRDIYLIFADRNVALYIQLHKGVRVQRVTAVVVT